MKLGRLVWVCVFALGAVALAGCQEVVKSTTYRFVVTASPSNLPSQDAEICQADTDNCVMTDGRGLADLDVPPNREVTITFEKEGYGPVLRADVSDETYGSGGLGDGRLIEQRMYPDEQLEAIAQQLGTVYPWEGGIVGLRTTGTQDFAGVTFTPVGSTVGAVGEPFYYDADSEPKQYSLDLEATTAVVSGHLLPLADGGFTEVTPEEQRFEFGGTAGDCSRVAWGWPVDGAPNTIRLPVRAGYMTYGNINCDGP